MSIFTAVVVSLSQATLCFAGACHPALVGVDTPTGQYRITHVATNEPGYSGDVLMFKENKHYVWLFTAYGYSTLSSKEPKELIPTIHMKG